MNQGSTVDPELLTALAAMPGLCGHRTSRDDVGLVRAVTLDDTRSRAACVAIISHARHAHYVAAVLTAGGDGWVIERAAQTTGEHGVPRAAPAIFIEPNGRYLLVGWTPIATATGMVFEMGPYRSSPTTIEAGVAIAEFVPPVEALGLPSRILYLDELGERRQSFDSTGGFTNAERSLKSGV